MMPDLPIGWRDAPLGEVLRVATRRENTEPEKIYRMLGVRLYGRGAFIRESRRGASLSVPYAHRVEAGDLVFSRLFASKGTFCVIDAACAGCHTSNEFPAFRVKGQSADLAYVLLQVCRPRFWTRVDAFCTGTTTDSRFRLNEKDFLRLRVPFPPVSEQRAISSVMDNARHAVAQQETVVQQAAETKRNVMRELLTLGVARDPLRLRPLSERWIMGRIAEGVAAAPEGWRLVQLTRVAKLESGHTPSRDHPEWWSGNIPWISLQDTDGLVALEIYDSAETIGPDGLANSSARLLPKGTVVFQRTASVGQCSIMGRPMATSQHFANWVCGPMLDPRYLLQVFRHMGREWERLQAGSVLPDIYMPTFKRLQILLPPRPEQERIADIGEAFDQRLEAERVHLAELRTTRDALAAELLSGRLRLPASVIARHAATNPKHEAA